MNWADNVNLINQKVVVNTLWHFFVQHVFKLIKCFVDGHNQILNFKVNFKIYDNLFVLNET